MHYVLLSFILYIGACGHHNPADCIKKISKGAATSHHAYQSEKFEEFLEEFEEETGIEIDRNIMIVFGPADALEYAFCATYNTGRREIIVKRETWDKMDRLTRKQLIYHEIGHCQFDLKHDNNFKNLDGDWLPTTLMNPSVDYLQAPYYEKHNQYYIEDLLNRIKEVRK